MKLLLAIAQDLRAQRKVFRDIHPSPWVHVLQWTIIADALASIALCIGEIVGISTPVHSALKWAWAVTVVAMFALLLIGPKQIRPASQAIGFGPAMLISFAGVVVIWYGIATSHWLMIVVGLLVIALGAGNWLPQLRTAWHQVRHEELQRTIAEGTQDSRDGV